MKAKAFLIILRDILFFGALLVVFALFHHVLPQTYEPIRTIAAPTPTPAQTQRPSGTSSQAVAEPTEEPAAPGDFTAVFPDADTGADAGYSYQTDDLRIAVTMVQENDITYFVADVWVRNIELFRTAFAGGEFSTGVTETVRRMAKDNNAILAVSGDFCGAHKSGTVIRNGVLYREDNGDKDVCVLYYDGTMEVYGPDEFSLDAAIGNGAWQAWSFGPSLLDEGRAATKFRSTVSDKNPRSAIGYYEPGHYCLVIVDGRQDGYSEGMTLAELSSLFASLGCREAYNLDGGATAMMVYDDDIISSPSGGGRASSDIICFLREGE
ncbi:MAG TPA: phosphodiester glycosidase family protein [Clostridia bacterium]|nr:phosphodiester glycosidase family protein [Clostridia bacterium]